MTIFSRTSPILTKASWTTSHPQFGCITFTTKKRSRTLHLTVKPFLGVQVHLPTGFQEKKALKFIDTKDQWIQARLARARQIEAKSLKFFNSLPHVSEAMVKQSLVLRLEQLARQYGFSWNKVSIRNQKTRWGSCSSQNNISLNRKLFYLPDHLRDYVLLHELAHTRQKNHSKDFWIILHRIIGIQETKQARLDLRDFDFLFYPPPIAEPH